MRDRSGEESEDGWAKAWSTFSSTAMNGPMAKKSIDEQDTRLLSGVFNSKEHDA